MSRVWKGRIYAFLTALIWGLMPVLIKTGLKASNPGQALSPLLGVFIAITVGTLCFTLWLRWFQPFRAFWPRDRRTLVYFGLAGVSTGLANILWYVSLNYAMAIVVTPVYSTYRLLTVIFSYLFLQTVEQVNWRVATGTLLIVGGTVLVLLK